VHDAALDAIRLFVALLAGAVLVAIVARRVWLPYSVGLVVVGVVLTNVLGAPSLAITPGLVLAVLLPGLIFEAALRTEFEVLRPSLFGVLFLAVPGVVIGAALVAVALNVMTSLAIGPAFLIGAAVAATDPAAVIATFSRIGAPRSLVTIVEAESLLNDGTSVVLFTLAITAISGGASWEQGLATFAIVVSASVALGTVAGFVATRLMTMTDDHLVELAISVILAYGSYLVADAVHLSGIITTVVAGVTLGWYGRTHGLSRQALREIDVVWQFIAFLLTALIFLLVGAAISLSSVTAALGPIAWAVAAVLMARAFVVYVLLGGASVALGSVRDGTAARRGIQPLPISWLHVLFWAGLRGAVAVALALALPADVPDREIVQGVIFGVVLFTLIVQGSTVGVVLDLLGIRGVRRHPDAGEEAASSG
jgi:CPA1 family monovalent cation:H+ antiporter